MVTKKKSEPKYGYNDFVNEMRALPFMTSIVSQADWRRGISVSDVPYQGDPQAFVDSLIKAKKKIILLPKFTANQWWLYATDGKHNYEEVLKYGQQGRKLLLDEDGNPREAKPRGRQKGSTNRKDASSQLDEFGMESTTSTKKQKIADKKEKTSGANLRIPEMIEQGILKVGGKLTISGYGKSEAVIIDGSTVKFGKKEMNYNQWGQTVTSWKALNIYKFAMYEGKLLVELRVVK